MNDKELGDLLKHCSPNILYVVNWKNRLVKLYTPFQILVLKSIGELTKGQVIGVSEIKITYESKVVFCIKGKLYHTTYFDILAI